MISDEPDEDADTLDDEGVLESCFGPDATKMEAGERAARNRGAVLATMQDWPPSRSPGSNLGLDAETLAWFRANHADWRQAIASVLRGWVAAKSKTLDA